MRASVIGALIASAALSIAQSHPRAVAFGDQSDPPKATYSTEATKSARRLLQATMCREPVSNIRAIVESRLYYNSPVFQQVKFEISKDGKVHQIVLAPLNLQGTEQVDNGTTLQTYTPDNRCVIIQPSAKQDGDDVVFRMNLVDRNYTLHVERKDKIAGRPAVVVVAVPREGDLETRCYSVDEKTGFLLRLETCKEGRAPMMHLNTKMVDFPADFPQNTFRLEVPFAKPESFHRRCVSAETASKLGDELGFQPAIPSKLPCGFATQQLQASTDSPTPALIFRLTDGLAKATVLQWRNAGSRHTSAPAGTVVDESTNLTVLVSGDIPDEVKRRILRAFLRAARSEPSLSNDGGSTSWVQELRWELGVLAFGGDSERTEPIILAVQAIELDQVG